MKQLIIKNIWFYDIDFLFNLCDKKKIKYNIEFYNKFYFKIILNFESNDQAIQFKMRYL